MIVRKVLREWDIGVPTRDAICPNCESTDIEMVYNDPSGYRYVKCPYCGRRGKSFQLDLSTGDMYADVKAYKSWMEDVEAKRKREEEIRLEEKRVNDEVKGMKILPCPHCLTKRIRINERNQWARVGAGRIFYAYCYNCKARGPFMATKKEAIEKWNHPYILRGVTDALTTIAEECRNVTKNVMMNNGKI